MNTKKIVTRFAVLLNAGLLILGLLLMNCSGDLTPGTLSDNHPNTYDENITENIDGDETETGENATENEKDAEDELNENAAENEENEGTADTENTDGSETNDEDISLLLKTIAEIEDYLSEQEGGTSTEDPIDLPLQLNLGVMNGSSNWGKFLNLLEGQDKFVNLDLSKCTMNGTIFVRGTIAGGKDKIVSIILPDTTTGIKKTSTSAYVFHGFDNLTTVILPPSLVSIGDNAFYNRTTLTKVVLHSTIPPELGKNVFYQVPADLEIHVPEESLDDYKNAEGWNEFSDNIVPL